MHCQPTEHDFAPFDSTRGMCRKCGQFTTAPDPDWLEKLVEAIHAQPHVCCPQPVYVPYYPQPYYPHWTTGTITSTPNITVWNGTSDGVVPVTGTAADYFDS